MSHLLETALLILCLLDFLLLTSHQLRTGIQWVALQGVLVGLLPLSVHSSKPFVYLFLFSLLSVFIKGWVFPFFLSLAIRDVSVNRESEPLLGMFPSIALSVLALGLSFVAASRLPTLTLQVPSLNLAMGFFTMAVGFLILIGRRLAVSQILGYLVLENGIYVLGVSLALEQPLLVELGVLLDVFVAVFVMGVIVFHIQREFDHIDTNRLSTLKDNKP